MTAPTDWSLDGVTDAIHNEVASADARYGPFTSTHEGYGVLAEEVAELLEAIRSNDPGAIQSEAMQVSAVAARIAVSLMNRATCERSGIKPPWPGL